MTSDHNRHALRPRRGFIGEVASPTARSTTHHSFIYYQFED
ncbi:hypothetical protein [Chroococcidiopsis sp.]